MNGPYAPSDWPGGCKCNACQKDFTTGQEMREQLVALDRETTIVAPLCVPCHEALPSTPTAHV